MDSPHEQYDIRGLSFGQLVEFMFDHDAVPIPGDMQYGPGPWYWRAKVKYNPHEVARFYIRLFSEPEFLLARYTPTQLEQAFWAIPSVNIDCSVTHIIWDQRVPFELRESCVRSMRDLYARLFSVAPLETASNMWWDALAYDWHCGIRARSNGGDDSRMQDVMFDTLLAILQLPQSCCQEDALHGLGHLRHPDTETAIQRFLSASPDIDIDPELKEYAMSAARFQVM